MQGRFWSVFCCFESCMHSWLASDCLVQLQWQHCININHRATLWDQLWTMWGPPAPPPAQIDEETEQRSKEESRAATAASLMHAIDLHSRRAVSTALAALPRVRGAWGEGRSYSVVDW